jgi:hypothetical protein
MATSPSGKYPAAPAATLPASAPLAELRDEPSEPHRTPTTDGSIAASLQALAEREPVLATDPMLQPLKPEEPVVDGGVLGRGAALSEILAPGAMRDAIVSVEYLVHRGDYAGAITAANKMFQEAARATASLAGASAAEAPSLHALMLGVPADRYLRFRQTAARAASGGAASADALYALFFIVDVALRAK